jgi:hypothetical protein
MAQFSPAQYDALERAITDRRRIAVYRRGTEYILIPTALRLTGGREEVEAVHPTTGDRMKLYVDEVDSFEVVR